MIDGVAKNGLPKRLYYVKVRSIDGSKRFTYTERGGGKYTHLHHAQACAEAQRRKGREARIFVTDTEWREL